MGLGKQAKVLTGQQIKTVTAYLGTLRNGIRNQTIFLLSVKAGLRAQEIAFLQWSMVLNSNGEIGDCIQLTNKASKGNSGRSIPLNHELKKALITLLQSSKKQPNFNERTSFVVTTERSYTTSPQTIVSMFYHWYRDIGLMGCSSHSGRRTFITNAARKISTVGGSIRDVQILAGHSSLTVTQRYIESNLDAQKKLVNLV